MPFLRWRFVHWRSLRIGQSTSPTSMCLGWAWGARARCSDSLFDCKTTLKLSAINRALWVAGLKQLVAADRAYIIQTKEAPYSHKLVANGLNVSIHSECSVRYAESIAIDFARDITYLDTLDIWDAFVGLRQSEPALADLVWFVTTQAA